MAEARAGAAEPDGSSGRASAAARNDRRARTLAVPSLARSLATLHERENRYMYLKIYMIFYVDLWWCGRLYSVLRFSHRLTSFSFTRFDFVSPLRPAAHVTACPGAGPGAKARGHDTADRARSASPPQR